MLLEGIGLKKSYGETQVLRSVDVRIKEKELVAIVGASGAGKSTLLHILGTLDDPDFGDVFLDGENLFGLKPKELAKVRNEKIGFVFQFHNLLPEFSALENVMLPGLIGKTSKEKLEKRAKELLEILNISHRIGNRPSELSGGEQQRVAVARALVNSPKVVMADEPSGNLDSQNAEELHDLFFKLKEELNQTFVVVTHNNEFASRADRKLTMKDGCIVE